MTAPTRDNSVLLATRITHLLLVTAVVPSFYVLTFRPTETATRFAWPLIPTMSAMCFGSLYFAVIYSFLRVTFAKRWHEVAQVLWATLPVLIALCAVTIVHWDKFAHGTVRFSIWGLAYLVGPPLVALLLVVNGRRDPRTPSATEVLMPTVVRRIAFLFGVLVGVVALALIFAPEFMSSVWPWPIKPLSSRALGSLFLAAATVQFAAALEMRWSALRIAAQSAILWLTLLIISAVRAFDQFDQSRPGTWMFWAFLGIEWSLAVGSYCLLESKRKRAESAVGSAR